MTLDQDSAWQFSAGSRSSEAPWGCWQHSASALQCSFWFSGFLSWFYRFHLWISSIAACAGALFTWVAILSPALCWQHCSDSWGIRPGQLATLLNLMPIYLLCPCLSNSNPVAGISPSTFWYRPRRKQRAWGNFFRFLYYLIVRQLPFLR